MINRAIVLIVMSHLFFVGPISAGVIRGKIYLIEGHISPACRSIVIKRQGDGALVYYRLPDTGADNSLLAVAMMAYSQDRNVTLISSDGVTTGCGTESRVEIIRITNPD